LPIAIGESLPALRRADPTATGYHACQAGKINGLLAPNGGFNPGNGGANVNGGWNYFSSRHQGLVQFAYGDGAVRAIKVGSTGIRNPAPTPYQTSDWGLLMQLGGMRDGNSNDTSGIAN
jgi:prepilin-type processing-associated H-X9-DG protein